MLQPGDVLLYTPAGVFGKLITLKTWSDYSHTEVVYRVQGSVISTYASRDPKRWFPKPSGGGVNIYPLRTSELGLIRRPTHPVDMTKFEAFVNATVGQKYDWVGLLKFFRISKGKQDRMFCSEAATRLLRAITGEQLFANVDADAVSPGMLAWTPELEDIWRA